MLPCQATPLFKLFSQAVELKLYLLNAQILQNNTKMIILLFWHAPWEIYWKVRSINPLIILIFLSWLAQYHLPEHRLIIQTLVLIVFDDITLCSLVYFIVPTRTMTTMIAKTLPRYKSCAYFHLCRIHEALCQRNKKLTTPDEKIDSFLLDIDHRLVWDFSFMLFVL